MTPAVVIAIAFTLAVSLASPLALRPILERRGIIDVPNWRSSHNVPVIRGGGLGPLAALAIGAMLVWGFNSFMLAGIEASLIVIAIAIAAGLLGMLEDIRGLPVTVRAAAQLVLGAIAGILFLLVTDAPWWLALLSAVGVAAYINVANFMDGINGISGLHGGVVGISYAAIGSATGHGWIVVSGLLIAAAFFGFLPWNLKGRLFLGDVGSYLLGGGIAAITAGALMSGIPLLAALGPIVIYLADAGFTLLRRVRQGDKWYEAHRMHIYQQLTDGGLRHLLVAAIVAVATTLTAGFGYLATFGPEGGVIALFGMAAVVVLYLLLPQVLRRFLSQRDSSVR